MKQESDFTYREHWKNEYDDLLKELQFCEEKRDQYLADARGLTDDLHVIIEAVNKTVSEWNRISKKRIVLIDELEGSILTLAKTLLILEHKI